MSVSGDQAIAAGTVVYDGVSPQYSVTIGPPWSVTVNGGPEGVADTLVGAQRIQFIDGYLAVGSAGSAAAEVYRAYEALLGRAPDAVGLAYWAHALDNGASLQTMVNGLLGSPEFQASDGALNNDAFVSLLIHNVPADHQLFDNIAAEQSNWMQYLAEGASRADLVLQFTSSYEDTVALAAQTRGLWVENLNAAEVARLYDTVLGRLPDASGLANWTQSLESGSTLQTVANGFVGSQEFQTVYGNLNDTDFVTMLYHNVLHRDPDPQGLNNWVGMLNSGQDSRAQVVVGFSESNEHIVNTAPHIDGGIWVAG